MRTPTNMNKSHLNKRKSPKMVQFAAHVEGGGTLGEQARNVEPMCRRRHGRRSKQDKDYRTNMESPLRRQ